MKNTPKNTKTKAVKKFEPKIQTCYIDIRNIDTDADMVKIIAISKYNAGCNLDVSEIAVLFDAQRYNFDKTLNVIFERYNTDLLDHQAKYLELKNDYEWATRPWYKKLMFWKKKPVRQSEFK